MQISDVIADMLTRIRNANNAKHETVDIPASNMKKAIADILLTEGYIRSYQIVEDGKQGIIRIVSQIHHARQGQGDPRGFDAFPSLVFACTQTVRICRAS